MAKTVTHRRPASSTGTRRTIGASTSGDGVVSLDDRPLAIVPTRDQKRLLVTLPWEFVVLDARTLEKQRSVDLDVAAPYPSEDADGVVWIGGTKLTRASAFGGSAEKWGTKLSGVVDRVAVLRPGLLVGVGSHGEIVWNVGDPSSSDPSAREGSPEPSHRRKAPEREVVGLVATADERAVFLDGSSAAWVVDPSHLSGYAQVRFRATSGHAVASEGIVALGLTSRGRCILAARDGGVAWTHADLRIAEERFVRLDPREARPLAVAGDERWIYVLRPKGLLQRFLIEQPKVEKPPVDPRRRPLAGNRQEPEEPAPLPDAQQVRLPRIADVLAILESESGPRLVFGGAQAEGLLGRVWAMEPETLAWEPIRLSQRTLVPPPEVEAGPQAPTFIATKSKFEGPPLASLSVDAVLAPGAGPFATSGTGTVLERPLVQGDAAAASRLLPGDAALLPAMVRFREGTARPAVVLWPGTARDGEVPEPTFLVWGDEPRAWLVLDTPSIRRQRWSRGALFPMQVALAAPLPALPGHRAAIPPRWVDPEAFLALARECKKALKVVW